MSVYRWAKEPFENFNDYLKELQQVLHLSILGISKLRSAPNVVEALIEISDDESERQSLFNDRASAISTAQLAEKELNNGFLLLHGQAVVSLWTGLEVLVRDFLCAWFENRPNAMEVEPIQKLKVNLVAFYKWTSEERISYIVETLERDLGAGLKMGVGRFECLFEAIGLGGELNDDLRKTIFELSQVRNSIVHRRGIADKKLLDACPWLALTHGAHVKVTHSAFGRYFGAVADYIVVVVQRVAKALKVESPLQEASKSSY